MAASVPSPTHHFCPSLTHHLSLFFWLQLSHHHPSLTHYFCPSSITYVIYYLFSLVFTFTHHLPILSPPVTFAHHFHPSLSSPSLSFIILASHLLLVIFTYALHFHPSLFTHHFHPSLASPSLSPPLSFTHSSHLHLPLPPITPIT